MPWIHLLLAALCEVGWAVGIKFTHGFTRLWPSVLTLAAMGLSVFFLGQAMKTLPMGTAYAVWTGLGACGTAALGMLFMGEPVSALRIASLVLILAGVAGLKLAAG
ncbi:MAG: quaternary ammonium compound-resistance protein sugE [Pseudomonadota bacterium]|jgi:quaternary ammonium compound-resistance protein SugE